MYLHLSLIHIFLIVLPAAIVTILLFLVLGRNAAFQLKGELTFNIFRVLPYLVVLIGALAGVNAVSYTHLEKTSSFEEALHILMGFIASRFRLNRIAVYMNWEREGAGHSAFQWVDDRTAMLFDPSDTFRQEEFYLSYNLYDSDGIAVLNRDKLEVYNTCLLYTSRCV